ncbi:hypothetical protein SKAU_G00192090 [Synaphobranchus kaupii]|uniref:PiggyBac transposable element-derived protein domain-containing protein n=1 Tax=Synaphobranchus kaupii TaxID=118154 RepID=A0A9Q1FDM2_SYNKA|nr:hypothetical protein SKAU_G00192090 [Synaphobranchus kaupii]
MVIYTGATTAIESIEGVGVSGSVVMTLLAPHLGKGHILYVDNWLDHFTGEPKVKPACVLDYNKKMGAVDRVNMITSFVDCARKSTKWYKKLFFHLLKTAVLNAYTVHRKLSEECMPYKDFRLRLVKELIQEHPLPQRSTGGQPCVNTPLRLIGRHFPSFVPPTDAQE